MATHSTVFLPREPQNYMKRQKDMTPEDEPPMSEGVQYANGEKQEQLLIAPERMKQLGQSRNDASCGCDW